MIKETLKIFACMFAWLGVFFVCIVVFFLMVGMWKMPLHNHQLNTLQKHFRAVEHPLNSTLVKRVKDFGNLFRGASNGCDYLVGELRVSEKTPENISRFYENVFVKPFDGSNLVSVELKFFDDEEFSEDYLWSTLWSDWYKKMRVSFDKRDIQGTPYVVFARQTDYAPQGDIRCFYEPAIH
ncbi:MAG: hypothetical protein Q8R17_02900 [bacterium]|nr:hypothetical protein [bacterium]